MKRDILEREQTQPWCSIQPRPLRALPWRRPIRGQQSTSAANGGGALLSPWRASPGLRRRSEPRRRQTGEVRGPAERPRPGPRLAAPGTLPKDPKGVPAERRARRCGAGAANGRAAAGAPWEPPPPPPAAVASSRPRCLRRIFSLLAAVFLDHFNNYTRG